jgi:hypothetical protein
MPAIENPPTTQAPADETVGPVRATRFDRPHEIPRAEPLSNAAAASALPVEPSFEAPLLEVASANSGLAVETITPALARQFRTQAQQLAGHLEARQRELDHREAELHTQLARHEAAARSARLWFQEQHRKLTQRQSEWERREKEISDRLRCVGGPGALHHDSIDVAGSSFDALPVIDDEINFRLREADFHEQSALLEARSHHTESLSKKLDVRFEHLEAAEERIARSEAGLQFARQEFHAEREAHTARVEKQRHQFAEQRARHEADLARRRAELVEQAHQLETRAAAIEQMRGELLQIQRDTLESQLAAEELRAELAGKAPPAALVQSLARLRVKLAEQYRLQIDDLQQQQQRLSDLAAQVTEGQRKLADRQRDSEAWITSQQRQIEEQAALLAEREVQLERQQNDRESRRLQREADQRELEVEVRRLQMHIRRLESNALEHA